MSTTIISFYINKDAGINSDNIKMTPHKNLMWHKVTAKEPYNHTTHGYNDVDNEQEAPIPNMKWTKGVDMKGTRIGRLGID